MRLNRCILYYIFFFNKFLLVYVGYIYFEFEDFLLRIRIFFLFYNCQKYNKSVIKVMDSLVDG